MTRKLRTLKLKFLAHILLLLVGLTVTVHGFVDNEIGRARELAFSGKEHRAEALALLQQRLEKVPDDRDALTLYGTILSWESRYDESRQALQKVLDNNPDHADALPAMLNMELWSDHPDRVEQLARSFLQRHPGDPAMMLFLARAQRNQNHEKEAAKTLDQLLQLQPSNQEALQMRRRMVYQARKWEAQASYSYDYLSAGRDAQHEASLSMRGPTPRGSLIGRFSRADRFGDHSYQLDADFYPHIRPGTYAYLNFGGSPDAALYPQYHLGSDIFQSVGHGFEATIGYRHLQFSDGVNIFTFALYKYRGDWIYSGRMYLTPDDIGVGKTGVFAMKRLFGNEGTHDFLEFRFSFGSSKALARTTLDIQSLNSFRFSVDYDKSFGYWNTEFKVGAGSEDQQIGGKLNRYTAQGSLYYRF